MQPLPSVKGEVLSLTKSELLPYLSEYLQGGYKQDELLLSHIEMTNGSITGYYDVLRYYMPADGCFHLTVPLAFLSIAQLGIIYACLDNQIPKKREIFIRTIRLKCKKQVSRTSGLEIKLILRRRMRRAGGVFYHGDIAIEKGAFVGSGSFLFPLPESSNPQF